MENVFPSRSKPYNSFINVGPGIDPSLMALGEGNSTLLQYSSLRNPMGGGCSPWDR